MAASGSALWYGDNLEVLRDEIPDESVDPIYLDPPFKSDKKYNVLYSTPDGRESAAQIQAFDDTWRWGPPAEENLDCVVAHGGKVAEVVKRLVSAIGKGDMAAYLVMTAARLLEMRRVFKDSGFICLHCDPVASHYVKVVMDSVFGAENFRNEIIWKRTSSRSIGGKKVGAVHDTPLLYGKTDAARLNAVWLARDPAYVEKHYRHVDENEQRYRPSDLTGAGITKGESGQPWRGVDPSKAGRHWTGHSAFPSHTPKPPTYDSLTTLQKLDKLDEMGLVYWPAKAGEMPSFKLYLDEATGAPVTDVITYIPPISSHAAERLNYPTQKPVALLERIIKLCTVEGGTVLDPFCGCGTAIETAHKLNMKWIGTDMTHIAIGLIEQRIRDAFGIGVAVRGSPQSMEGARDLAARDKLQFEQWAVMRIPHMRPNEKQVGDRGVGGTGWFRTPDGYGKVVVSVKGSKNVNPGMVRDLCGTLGNKGADLGVFLMLEEPTRKTAEAAAQAGIYRMVEFESYPKVQIWTVSQYLAGVPLKLPPLVRMVETPRQRTSAGRQARL